MIKYALRCNQSHDFESWFRDSRSFDDQVAADLVECPTCGSTEVSKALMAPAVVTSRKRASQPTAPSLPVPAAPSAPEPVTVVDDPALKVRAALREFRDHVVKNSQDVGTAFATEVRKIHGGAAEQRAIRGEASADEVRSLHEDGIDVMALPVFPDDRN